MHTPDLELDDFLEQLRREFIETTSERLNTVDDLITSMMEGDQISEALSEFMRHIHSIKGQGSTFDFSSVSTIAHRLEDYIETAPEYTDRQLKDIQSFVDVIRQIIESGVDPEEPELLVLLDVLPDTAKDFSELEPESVKETNLEIHILLVMQKGIQRKIIGKELAACGFKIANVDTPVEAIKYAIEHKPEVTIVSRVMEQMGGA